MVFNATFNNISVKFLVKYKSNLLVEKKRDFENALVLTITRI